MMSAIILAAGQSKRMGQPKMVLPWGDTTIIEQVIAVYAAAGVDDILVVTGGARALVEAVVRECATKCPVRCVYNEAFEHGEMLSSIQCGLRELSEQGVGAALIGLGDQPQIEVGSVQMVLDARRQTHSPLIVPSFQKRRGHPWLVASQLWDEILNLTAGQTPRDFLNRHVQDIFYVDVASPGILADLDTPEAYHSARPQNGRGENAL
jgi:molybdenum cofactor cytidylyltransferase